MGLNVYCLCLVTAFYVAACAADSESEQHCRLSTEQQHKVTAALLQRETKSASETRSALDSRLHLAPGPVGQATPVQAATEASEYEEDPAEYVTATEASPPKPEESYGHGKHEQLPAPPHGHNEQAMARSLATTIIGMVVTLCAVLYLVHWPDKGMRRASWKVLSETLIIFCAVLFFDAYFKISTLLSPYEEPMFDTPHVPAKHRVVGNFFRFLVAFCGFEGFLYWTRTHAWWMHPFGYVGSHFLGFCIISCFGSLQQTPPWSESVVGASLLTLLAIAVVACMFFISGHIRGNIVKAYQGTPMHKQMNEWRELVTEFEDDAAGLALGLLITQVIKFLITGHLAPVHGSPKDKTPRQVFILLCAALASFVLIGVTASWLHEVRRNESLGHHRRRMAQMVIQVSSMTTGWSLLYWGMWKFWTVTGNKGVGEGDVMSARLCLVGVNGLGGFIAIFLLNHVANKGFLRHDTQRSLIDIVGLLCGLSWESCVNVAMEGIHSERSDQQFRIFDGCTDLFIALIVTPAWAFYILPHALSHMKEETYEYGDDEGHIKHPDGSDEEPTCCCPIGG